MKAIKLTLLLLFITTACIAQNKEGYIIYENKINIHRKLSKEMEAMKSMIQEFKTEKFKLFFNTNESLLLPFIEDEMEEETKGGNIRIGIIQSQRSFKEYKNISKELKVKEEELDGKTYLIEEPLTTASGWKIGDKTKVILGYTCREAFKESEVKVKVNNQDGSKLQYTAWFTTELPFTIGPRNSEILPGAILALDKNNGEQVTVAKEIKLKPITSKKLKMPNKGSKISSAEYDKMQEEKIKQVMKNRGSNRISR